MAHDTPDRPTIDDHPGLHNDEAMDEGKMMTAEEAQAALPLRLTLRRSRSIPGSTTTRLRMKAR